MTRFDDELTYVCAWGRWRIGPALNEPMTPRPERRAPKHTRAAVARPGAQRARLRLVAGTARAPETPR